MATLDQQIRIINILSRGADEVITYDKLTLDVQGHKDTGSLENSLEYRINFTPANISIDFCSATHGVFMDKGVKAVNVKVGYHHLIGWARRKKPGLSNREINNFVFAVIATMKKKGMPTPGSKAFSKTGERKGWVRIGTRFLNQNFDHLFNIDDILFEMLDDALAEFGMAA